MIKLKPNLVRKWPVKGYQGRHAGYRCIIKCLLCNKEKELTLSVVNKGNGIFCSRGCRAQYQSKSRIMENHPNWNGGIRYDKRGYVLIKQVTGNKGYVREHRLVMEKHLSRKLEDWEWIHHKNGIKNDNTIENLAIVVAETHKGEVRCPHCLTNFYIK